jgi:predicted O-methyltransferase YrrM
MNTVLQEILRTRRVRRPKESDSVPLTSAVASEEGELLQRLVRGVDATVTLEVGLAYGVSALYICDALQVREDTRHYVIDPNQRRSVCGECWDGVGIGNLERAGFAGIVRLIEKPSHLALPELEAAGVQVDFAFIDGWHTFDFTLVDFFYVDHLLRVGGIVVFDDCNWPAIRKACRFVATNRAYSAVDAIVPPPSRKRRVAEWVLAKTPLGRLLRLEERRSDAQLGIHGSCVAFRKDRRDDRPFSHFAEF